MTPKQKRLWRVACTDALKEYLACKEQYSNFINKPGVKSGSLVARVLYEKLEAAIIKLHDVRAGNK